MKRIILPIVLISSLVLSACAAVSAPNSLPTATQNSFQSDSVIEVTATPTDDPAILATLFPNMSGNTELTRSDSQGAIIADITPLNMGVPADTLDLNVVLTTHSIDLSMDLAALSTITTDTGVKVAATLWDAPRGGHHVEGKLIFPATKDGKRILDGATKLTLTIVNLDAESRVFEWTLK
jgi:hypothetical protein